MSHKYLIESDLLISPIIGICDKPIRFIEKLDRAHSHVLVYCEDGHLIGSRMYDSKDKAYRLADRLGRLVDLAEGSK